jgi:hypothetical protein
MTTEQIEQRADPSSVAVADINLKLELRHNVIPEFLEGVGYVAWRRKHISKTLAAAASYVDVSESTYSFAHMKQVFLGTDLTAPLRYIGEDPMEVLSAKANTTAGQPSGYYLESDGNDFQRVSFNCPAQQQYIVWMTLDLHIKFPNDTDSIDLDPYIPSQFQWGLVAGLRKTIYRERFGIGDERYQEASAEFEKWQMRAKKSSELARKETAKYAR